MVAMKSKLLGNVIEAPDDQVDAWKAAGFVLVEAAAPTKAPRKRKPAAKVDNFNESEGDA